MTHRINPISLPMPLNMGTVNSYLIKEGEEFFLIDTGGSNGRETLLSEIRKAGCRKGSLKLIILTHGDFDHAGNAACLQDIMGAKVVMHVDDAAMVERGDMFINRKKPNILVQKMIPVLSGFGRSERFKPDIAVKGEYDLSRHGFNARIILLPGHSRGSIGILTGNGDLFCGDILENTKGPAVNKIMDDNAAAGDSVKRISTLNLKTIYPGHGRPFEMAIFIRKNNLERHLENALPASPPRMK